MEKPENIHPEMVSIIEFLSMDNSDETQEKAMCMLTALIESYDIKAYPDYSKGLAGIGCGVQYILYHKHLDGEIDDALSEIDEHLGLAVYFRDHIDLTHATGLLGIATYFFYRLEAPNACDMNLKTLTAKTILILILDTLLSRLGVNGYAYADLEKYPEVTDLEKKDINRFASEMIKYGICDELICQLLDALGTKAIIKKEQPKVTVSNDLGDVTVVLPFRIDSEEREKNLHTLLRYYTQHTNLRFILLEADSKQYIKNFNYTNCTYEFIIDDDPIFYHTFYRNQLIKKAETPIIIVWDIDILVPLEQLYRAAHEIRYNYIDLCYPYNSVCYNLTREQTLDLKYGDELTQLVANENQYKTMFGKLTVGGVFFINKDKYMEVGLENENFKGWGPEDMERLKRLTILGFSVKRTHGVIFHLWHPRIQCSIYRSDDHEIEGRQKFLEICKKQRGDLLKRIRFGLCVKNKSNMYML